MLQKKSSDKFLKIINFFFLFFLVLGFYYGLVFVSDFFKVKTIKIIGKEKIIGIEDFKNKLIFFIFEDDFKKIIYKKNPLIASLILKKIYPSTLEIEIKKEKPIAQLIVNNGYLILNNQGKILFKKKEKDLFLPEINFYQKIFDSEYSLGDTIDFKDIIKGLFFLKKINEELNLKCYLLDIKGNNMLVFNLENNKIILSADKDKEEDFYQLKEIIKNLKILGKNYKEIDLRFDKPIIRF